MISIVHTSPFILHPLILLMASLLDLAIGDPRWLPHPVRIIGNAINKTEMLLRKFIKSPFQEKLGGILLVIIIVVSVFIVTFLTCITISYFSDPSAFSLQPSALLTTIVLIYLTSTTIAVRELISSARLVITSVKNKNIESARSNLSMIVGRDTRNLSDKEVLRATIETLSENLSDGVIAPLFYLAIGGLPLAMAYKAINTLDSMVGYKNNRYKNFGWAAARLDDIANYIPSRITGILIIITSALFYRSISPAYCSLKTMLSDGRRHPSPNAGIPEAAMAGAIGISLGGPSTYNGIEIQKPYIGIEKIENYLLASEKAMDIIKASSLIGISIAVIILSIRIIG